MQLSPYVLGDAVDFNAVQLAVAVYRRVVDASVTGTSAARHDHFSYTDRGDHEHLLFELGSVSGRSASSVGRSL